MLIIDNSGVIAAYQRLRAELAACGLPQPLRRLLHLFPGAEHIIRRHAGLPGVEPLAPGDTPGCQGKIRVRRQDTGAFPTQLQHHRRQVTGRGGHDRLTHRHRSGKEDHIKGLLKQRLGFLPAALQARHSGRRHIFDHRLQGLGHRRRILRGLDQRRIAGGQRPHQRA